MCLSWVTSEDRPFFSSNWTCFDPFAISLISFISGDSRKEKRHEVIRALDAKSRPHLGLVLLPNPVVKMPRRLGAVDRLAA